MPQAMSMFGDQPHPEVVGRLAHARLLASSAGFWAPLTRHLWWWLGARDVSRASFVRQLKSGRSVILCPGGVQECLYMRRGVEVIYLKRRTGFVRCVGGGVGEREGDVGPRLGPSNSRADERLPVLRGSGRRREPAPGSRFAP